MYRCTIRLLLQQVVRVYYEAASLNIELDIHEMLNERLAFYDQGSTVKKGGLCDSAQIKGICKSGVVRVEKKAEIPIPRGKWNKNRNSKYMKQKQIKNTQRKIANEGEKRKQDSMDWLAGGPRPKLLLKTLKLLKPFKKI